MRPDLEHWHTQVLPHRFMIYISVGVHTGHTVVANFYNSPVKKLMQFAMRRKMFVQKI